MTVGMRALTVRHVTVYRYSKPVGLGEHRMMFRPRESHDLRLVSTRLDILPRPTQLRWLHDVFDNSVAIATFGDPTLELRFDSAVTLEHLERTLPHYALEIEAQTLELGDLGLKARRFVLAELNNSDLLPVRLGPAPAHIPVPIGAARSGNILTDLYRF